MLKLPLLVVIAPPLFSLKISVKPDCASYSIKNFALFPIGSLNAYAHVKASICRLEGFLHIDAIDFCLCRRQEAHIGPEMQVPLSLLSKMPTGVYRYGNVVEIEIGCDLFKSVLVKKKTICPAFLVVYHTYF